MRKSAFFVLTLTIAASLAFSGCNKTKTYAEKLKAEKRAIERFMDRNNYYLLKTFPADSVFTDSLAFYRTSEGLYIHVIDKRFKPYGEFQDNAIENGSTVAVRYCGKSNFMLDPDSVRFSNWDKIEPELFIHGRIDNTDTPQGWEIALDYVDNFGLVRMIIPSIIGTSSNNSLVNPVFYDSVWFKLYY